MTLEMLRAALEDKRQAAKKILDDHKERNGDTVVDLSEEDQTRFDGIMTEAEDLKGQIETAERNQERLDRIDLDRATDRARLDTNFAVRKDPYDISDLRIGTSAHDLRARAMTAIEQDPIMPDHIRSQLTDTLRRVDRGGELAMLYLNTGSEAYRQAFFKLVSGHAWALTDAERAAVERAQNTANADGGFAVPFTLDPTLILTNDGAINPMRGLATIKTITTEDWNGVTSAGTTANWRAEAGEASDDALTLAQPNIPVHKMDIFTPYSIEIGMDWAQLESEVREAMSDARFRLEATAHFTGTGSGQPTGLVTALVAASPSVTVSPATAETFALADVYSTRREVPPRFRMTRDQPVWFANLGTYDDIRQFDTGGGGGFWTDMTDGTPDRLLSYRTFEASAMADSSDINPAATANNRILICGDPKQFFIVDRVGMRVENIPHLFGANNRPTGQRGIYGYLRTGSDVIVDNAFRMLDVVTAV